MNIPLSPCVPENLVSRDGFSRAVPSRVSLLISILRLNLVLTYGIPPEFRGGVHYETAIRHRRAATRAKLVRNLRNAAQGLAALQVKQQEQFENRGEEGRGGRGDQPSLIGGDSIEARAVCLALEQCLFHGIRVKEFGVIPLWAFLERVERLPLSGLAGSRPSSRDRGLSSIRNTVGAVASFGNVSTPLGRARAWIRQCLVSKCLEACLSTMLEEDRLVKVFYEGTALARCREGSTILLRLCSALETFDLAIDADQSILESRPRWPILDEQAEWDRRAEEAAAAGGGAARGNSAPNNTASPPALREDQPWFEQQRERQQREQREEGRGPPERRNWAASIDQFGQHISQGETWEKLEGVLGMVNSTVDQAVNSLDETINDLFGAQGAEHHPRPPTKQPPPSSPSLAPSENTPSITRRLIGDGWVELRGGDPYSKPAASAAGGFLDDHVRGVHEEAAAIDARTPRGHAGHSWASMHSSGGYPGAFIMGRRRGKNMGRGRVFGAPLEELVMNPNRCKKGLLDPLLGVPDAVLSVLEALKQHDLRNVGGLFVQEASESNLLWMVKNLEKRNSVPSGPSSDYPPQASPAWIVSRLTGVQGREAGIGGDGGGGESFGVTPHVLASTLVFFLHRLPEPLLTFDKRDAFLSCEAIPELDARVRNVKLLVEDLPWAHQPLLLAIVDLFSDIAAASQRLPLPPSTAWDSYHDETNANDSSKNSVGGAVGLSLPPGSSGITSAVLRDAAEGLAPAILRPRPTAGGEDGAGAAAEASSSSSFVSRRPEWEDELAATAVVELILTEQDRMLKGMRAEQRLREKRLSLKVERLGQLQNMFAATVYLERSTHLALVISIWRRLESMEHEILEKDALGGEEALGLDPSTASGTGVAAGPRDEDRDVRELENMLLGLEGADAVGSAAGGTDGVPELSAPEGAEDVLVGPLEATEHSTREAVGVGGAVHSIDEPAAASSAAATAEKPGVESIPSPSLAFTIEDEGDTHQGIATLTTTTAAAAAASHSEDESIQDLLGSIADTLTPSSSGGGGDHESYQPQTKLRAPPMTPSEMALVELMEEAGEEAGELLGAGSRAVVGRASAGSGVFDDAFDEGSTAVGSRETAPGGVVGGDHGAEHHPGASHHKYAAALPPPGAVARDVRPAKKHAFSLDHERWITCGFTVGFVLSEGGHEKCVGSALRGASTVLALDSINYFLVRYPRSASRVIKSAARRHSFAGAGGDSDPFPVHAGDLTGIIADLLSLLPPSATQPSSAGESRSGPAAAAAAEASDIMDDGDGRKMSGHGVEPADVRALRLAALPTWPLLDAPNAFHEVFACAALVLEAAQVRGNRGHQHLRYQECLLETRQVLHACVAHTPCSVDGFWAAAAAEGGVSPDPEDMPPQGFSPPGGAGDDTNDDENLVELPLEENGEEARYGKRRCALAREFERVLGMSDLELWEEDLPALGHRKNASKDRPDSSRNVVSSDGRLCFGDDPAGDGEDGGGLVSSDWLLAGETARAGMIESIASENSEQSGPAVVWGGAFQARLLRPSQIFSTEDVRALSKSMPITVASHDWVCLYSNSRHGTSLETLLARCAGWAPTLVIVEALAPHDPENGNATASFSGTPETHSTSHGAAADEISAEEEKGADSVGKRAVGKGATKMPGRRRKGLDRDGTVVFGGFASGAPWTNMGRAFAGDGRSFIFAFDRRGSEGQRRGPRVLEWAGSDRSFMTSGERIGLGMGGGGSSGSFGFFLEPDLLRASTGPCETFGNKLLLSGGSGEVLEVLGVEVWGFSVAKALKGFSRIAL